MVITCCDSSIVSATMRESEVYPSEGYWRKERKKGKRMKYEQLCRVTTTIVGVANRGVCLVEERKEEKMYLVRNISKVGLGFHQIKQLINIITHMLPRQH